MTMLIHIAIFVNKFRKLLVKILYWSSTNNCKIPHTLVCTIDTLWSLIFLTNSDTLMLPVLWPAWQSASSAIKVPVRPTPALRMKTESIYSTQQVEAIYSQTWLFWNMFSLFPCVVRANDLHAFQTSFFFVLDCVMETLSILMQKFPHSLCRTGFSEIFLVLIMYTMRWTILFYALQMYKPKIEINFLSIFFLLYCQYLDHVKSAYIQR